MNIQTTVEKLYAYPVYITDQKVLGRVKVVGVEAVLLWGRPWVRGINFVGNVLLTIRCLRP